jgi:hypothetical protein
MLFSTLDGDHRKAVHSIQGLMATLYSFSTARQMLLELGAHKQPSTRAAEIEASLREKLSALLPPE